MTACSPPAPRWDTLAAYYAGECAPTDADVVTRWLHANPVDRELLERLHASTSGDVLRAALTHAPLDVEDALRRMHARRRQGLVLVRPSRATRPVRRWLVGGLVAAAAAAALVVRVGLPARARVVETAVRRRDSLRLDDGTRVILAPGSRLVVAAGYGAAAREVSLDGAAWFSVRHDAAHPFVVHAGASTVRDLGTQFVVRTDGVGGGVAVAVAEGSVALDARVLQAGDRGVSRDGAVVARRGVVGDDDLSWTRGTLTYHDAPLDVVRADLRRWYGVDLRVADSAVARLRLTATFDGERVDEVLRVIALALGTGVERDGAVATLRRASAE